MKRIAVVTGGAGFVGRRLVSLLAGEARQPGWPAFDRVHVLDTAVFRPLDRAEVEVTSVQGDVRSIRDLEAAFEDATTVFHTASIVDVGLRPNRIIDDVNVRGTRNVLEAARSRGVRHVVYTSSEDVVLSEVPSAGLDESAPYPSRPLHDYVRTKIEAEKLALAAHDLERLRTVSIRPVHVYGPEDPHAIVTSLRAFATGRVPILLGPRSARFDVVYVDNVAHAHLLAASQLESDAGAARIGGRAYFVGEDNALNYFEFLRPYAERKGVKMPAWHFGRRRTRALATAMEWVHRLTGADVPFHRFHASVIGQDFYFSSERAKRELGYRPIVTPTEGLARTLAWLDGVSLDA